MARTYSCKYPSSLHADGLGCHVRENDIELTQRVRLLVVMFACQRNIPWSHKPGLLNLRLGFANLEGCRETRQSLCQPFANPSSPTLCQPFLPTPLQAPLSRGPHFPWTPGRDFFVNFFWSPFPAKRSTKTPQKVWEKFGAKFGAKFWTKIPKKIGELSFSNFSDLIWWWGQLASTATHSQRPEPTTSLFIESKQARPRFLLILARDADLSVTISQMIRSPTVSRSGMDGLLCAQCWWAASTLCNIESLPFTPKFLQINSPPGFFL